ncbi:MAG: hypothetical protein WKF77_27420, partial [Planctomycetaceae bacterium]
MPKNGQSMGSTHGSQAPEFGCTIESVHWPIGDADAATVQVKFGEAPVILVKYDANGKRIADAQVDAALQNSSCQQLLDGVEILRTGPHEDGFAVWTNPFSSSTDLGSVGLTLIDKSGNEQHPFESSGNGTENVNSFKVAPADVAAIAIRLRSYTHVATFENVSLQAGKQSEVKVSIAVISQDSPVDSARSEGPKQKLPNANPLVRVLEDPDASTRIDPSGDPMSAGMVQRFGGTRFKYTGWWRQLAFAGNDEWVWLKADEHIAVMHRATGRIVKHRFLRLILTRKKLQVLAQ